MVTQRRSSGQQRVDGERIAAQEVGGGCPLRQSQMGHAPPSATHFL